MRFPWASTLVLLFSFSANAKLFSNSYVSFELPPSWDCTREGTEWLCVSQFERSTQKEAIIVLTAKEVGPADTLAQYLAHLQGPRLLPVKGGSPVPSKVYTVQNRMINNHPWVDGLHFGSEISTYYTRYLATVKDRIAILVTFSAHRTNFTKYSSDFIRAIDSLRVTATKDLLGKTPTAGQQQGAEMTGTPIPTALGPSDTVPLENSTQGSPIRKMLGLALILLAVGIFLVMRRKKKKGK